MEEGDGRGLLGEGFEGEGDDGGSVAALGDHLGDGDGAALDVGHRDGPLLSAGEDGDDAAEGCCFLEQGKEVGDEAVSGVDYQGRGEVESFGCLCDIIWLDACPPYL